jgi:hypothetical protein
MIFLKKLNETLENFEISTNSPFFPNLTKPKFIFIKSSNSLGNLNFVVQFLKILNVSLSFLNC